MKTDLLRGCVAAVAALAVVSALPEGSAQAQEIQLTGPLAGQPPVRKQRLYRQGRFEIAPTWSFSLLDEYRRTMIAGARLNYNITEWLSFGVWGGYGVVSMTTDLTDNIDKTSPTTGPGAERTKLNVKRNGAGKADFSSQAAKMEWFAVPQLTFTPFRGKLALFNSIFVDTDAYIHGGLAFIGVKERKDCGDKGQVACTDPKSFDLQSRVAIAPSFGLGMTFYPSKIVSFGLEYRALPFEWNRSGFDSRGGPPNGNFPDLKVNSEDRTFKFNQLATIFVGFSFPDAKISE